MNNNIVIGIIVGAVVIGGAGFFAGTKYASATATPANGFQRAVNGNVQGRTGARGGAGTGFIAGKILSVDANSVTIELTGAASSTPNQATGSKIVLLSGSTQIGKMTAGSVSDLTVGTTVTVNGTPNSDGSVTAQSVQIRPAGAGPGFGGRGQ